jgi:hypothetical protein
VAPEILGFSRRQDPSPKAAAFTRDKEGRC